MWARAGHACTDLSLSLSLQVRCEPPGSKNLSHHWSLGTEERRWQALLGN